MIIINIVIINPESTTSRNYKKKKKNHIGHDAPASKSTNVKHNVCTMGRNIACMTHSNHIRAPTLYTWFVSGT